MLRALFDRLRARPERAGPVPSVAEAERGATPPAAPSAVPAADTPLAPIFGARRPLVSRAGQVAGFEFRLAESTERRLTERPDPAALAAHTSALLTAMRLTALGGRLAYTELPAAWLERASRTQDIVPGLWLAVRGAASPALDPLRRAGARLAFEGVAGADFVLIRHRDGALDATVDSLERARHASAAVPLLALDLPSLDDVELALRIGATYACGTLTPRTEPAGARPLPPDMLRICRLMNRLLLDTGNAEVADELKQDVGLSVRLMSTLNSAGFALSRPVETIEQAVLMLGRNELYRWLSVLLVGAAQGRPTARALQEIALARGRLMERLAVQRGEPTPGSLFMLGLASMLGALLEAPLAAAVSPLHLPAPATDALLHARGPWRPYLDLAVQLERQHHAAAEALALPFGGMPTVLALADEAWAWAAAATGGMRT